MNDMADMTAEKGEKIMMDKVKGTWSLLTVKIAIGAVLVSLVSLYLPWFTYGGQSQTLNEAMKADPDFFVGAMPVMIAAAIWIVVFFLLNHPKLTLLGDVAMLFMYAAFAVAADDRNLNQGVGFYLYLVAAIVCIVCAFATKKRR